jgi:peptidoglycan/xylan/chitin deacetylase (PgdA/CDA1 family)
MRAIFTYHSIDDSGSVISVSEPVFRAQVASLAASGIPVVPLEELLSMPPDESAVALTFDDALTSFGETALPILVESGFPSTLYVVSAKAGRRSTWDGGLGGVPASDLMDWQALGFAAETGLVAIGGHTRTHPRLPCLGDAEAEDEILGCADDIERSLGLRPDSFAYPYGYLDDRAVRLAAGRFTSAVTTVHDVLGSAPDRHRLPRIDMWYFRHRTDLGDFGTLRYLGAVRGRRLARAARRAVQRGPCA